MAIRTVLAENLRQMRALRGISQEELAHKADLDRTYVSAIEREVYAASVDVLERIAKVLKIEPADLISANRPAVPAEKPQKRRSKS